MKFQTVLAATFALLAMLPSQAALADGPVLVVEAAFDGVLPEPVLQGQLSDGSELRVDYSFWRLETLGLSPSEEHTQVVATFEFIEILDTVEVVFQTESVRMSSRGLSAPVRVPVGTTAIGVRFRATSGGTTRDDSNYGKSYRIWDR
jgi:hypothetical protein